MTLVAIVRNNAGTIGDRLIKRDDLSSLELVASVSRLPCMSWVFLASVSGKRTFSSERRSGEIGSARTTRLASSDESLTQVQGVCLDPGCG